MMPSSDEQDRKALLQAVAEALRGPQERWHRVFGADESAPSAPGTILRVPDAVLQQHGLEAPASVIVMAADDDGEVCVVPIRLTERAGPGEILIEEARSPFMTGFCIVAWLPLRLPAVALAGFTLLARAPAALDIVGAIGTIAPPVEGRETKARWGRLIAELLPSAR